jgi:hypothetical protein
MRCPKCHGLMSYESFRSTHIEAIPWAYEGWRCVYCGAIIDPLVLLNRKKNRPTSKDTSFGNDPINH